MPVWDVDVMRSLSGLLSRLGGLRKAEGMRPAGSRPEPEQCPVVHSRALPTFLSHVGTRPAPVLLDLGPLVGSNVTFFGERLNCKVFVEDLSADLDRHLREGRLEELPAFLSTRFILEEGTVDGVLLWDLYDHLDRPAAQALASTLVRLLRVGGSLLGYFSSASHVRSGFTRFIVADESHLRQQTRASPAVRRGIDFESVSHAHTASSLRVWASAW